MRSTKRSARVLIPALAAALVGAALFAPAAPANDVVSGTTPIAAVSASTLTVPASGTFTFTTSPGILTTWQLAGISVVGISPGSVITTSQGLSARIILPVVAKTGTANATAGGFRLLNSDTGASVRCQVPTVDTRARLVECILADGTRDTLFVITDIAQKFRTVEGEETTSFFRGIDLSLVDSRSAVALNKALSTNVFSASVSIARGEMEVTRVIPRL